MPTTMTKETKDLITPKWNELVGRVLSQPDKFMLRAADMERYKWLWREGFKAGVKALSEALAQDHD